MTITQDQVDRYTFKIMNYMVEQIAHRKDCKTAVRELNRVILHAKMRYGAANENSDCRA